MNSQVYLQLALFKYKKIFIFGILMADRQFKLKNLYFKDDEISFFFLDLLPTGNYDIKFMPF